MENKVTIIGNMCDAQMIEELNVVACGCTYEYSGHRSFVPDYEFGLIVIYELAKSLAHSAAYDLLKSSLSAIISKTKSNRNKVSQHGFSLTAISTEKTKKGKTHKKEKIVIHVPPKQTSEQQDKLIEDIVQKLLKQRMWR